jgi:hypothetical protein
MSFTTIHFDASDYCGTDFDARRVKLWATNNAEDETIHDPDGHVYIGSGNGTIAADGQASITVPVPEAGWNPITCQTTLHLDYPDRNSRARNGRETKTFGPFTVPEGSIAGLITNVALTSNVASLTTSAAHGLSVGYTVTIAGYGAPFDGEHVVTAVTSTSTFDCVIVAADVASTAAAALFSSNDIQLNDLVEQQEVPPVYLTTVTAALDAKVTEAEAAASAAAASAASAQSIVTADLDTATAVLVPDVGTATGAALSATIATAIEEAGGGAGAVPAFQGLKTTIAAAAVSTGIQWLGDSTGNESDEPPRLMLADLAASQPALTFQEVLWSDTTQDCSTRATIQTGTAGVLYASFNGTQTERTAPSVSLTGALDLRAKIRATDYTPTAGVMVLGSMESAKRSWSLCISTAGALVVMYSTDGAGVATLVSNANLATADNTDIWIRAVFTPNDGGGNRTGKFYTSTDGATWTQLGTTVTTAGAVTLHDPGTSSTFRIGGTPVGAYGRFVGRIYEAQVRDGEGGGTVVPCVPDLWSDPSGTAGPIVGAPVVTLVNGSHVGAGLTYLNAAGRVSKMTPHYGQAVTILSDSHNDSKTTGSTFLAAYDAWRVAVAARVVAPQIILTQNPQNPSASNDVEHSVRRLNLLTYGPAKSVVVIDTYQTFLNNPDWLAEWMEDTVHPNALGSAAWWAAMKAGYDALP